MCVCVCVFSFLSNNEKMMKKVTTLRRSVAGWEKDFKGNDKQM